MRVGRLENSRGIRPVEVVPVVVGALGAVNKRLDTWFDKLGIIINTGFLQKTALLGTARILRKVQSIPDNSNLQGKSKKVRVIGSSKKN